jgi:hypothetical protein
VDDEAEERAAFVVFDVAAAADARRIALVGLVVGSLPPGLMAPRVLLEIANSDDRCLWILISFGMVFSDRKQEHRMRDKEAGAAGEGNGG